MASFGPVLSHLPHRAGHKEAALSGIPALSAAYICPRPLPLLFVGGTLFCPLLWASLGLAAATTCAAAMKNLCLPQVRLLLG